MISDFRWSPLILCYCAVSILKFIWLRLYAVFIVVSWKSILPKLLEKYLFFSSGIVQCCLYYKKYCTSENFLLDCCTLFTDFSLSGSVLIMPVIFDDPIICKLCIFCTVVHARGFQSINQSIYQFL